MLRWVALILGLLIFSGCAARWEHASKRPGEFYIDDQDCQVETGGASQGLEPGRERLSYETCMWQKGWHKKKGLWFFDPASQ